MGRAGRDAFPWSPYFFATHLHTSAVRSADLPGWKPWADPSGVAWDFDSPGEFGQCMSVRCVVPPPQFNGPGDGRWIFCTAKVHRDLLQLLQIRYGFCSERPLVASLYTFHTHSHRNGYMQSVFSSR